MKLLKAVPILYADDVTVSTQYFIEQLKFEGFWHWGDPPDFAGVHRDGVEVFFCKGGQGQPATWLSIVVDDVDAYFELIKHSGAKILSLPQTMEWNMREMLIECPDGHMLRVGHNTECD